ncbi:MAG TPA: hypothetical protein EYQ60_14300 [Myxococcales bacterium]|nr:hypothetical protein [Myxococcales bacterium]HIK86039.1 hypothetical protein [Myxococcales bacterium]
MRSSNNGYGYALDGLIGAALISLIYLPVPSIVAGWVFAWDRFYHWDHFMIAQALAHQHGMALSLDVYAPYGLGWPTLLSSISGVWPLSHQGAIEFAAFFCGIYAVSVYALMRVAVSSRSLALAGTVFSLWLGFFSPLFDELGTGLSNWQWPSMLSLRAPFDALFFLALLMHGRSGRPVFSVAAAGLAGLGLYFETETGLMLIGTYIVYWVCALLFGSRTRDEWSSTARSLALPLRPVATLWQSAIAFVLVLAIGLVISTHGRFFYEPAAVLASWLGGLLNAVSVSSLLFSRFVAQQSDHLFFALGSFAICLYAVSETAMKALHRRLDPTSLLLGCVGFYGAGRLLLFVWNSQAIRIRLVGLSIAIILTLELKRYLDSRGEASRRHSGSAPIARAAPVLILITTVALLFSSPTYVAYPNRWNLDRTQEVSRGEYLIPDRREIFLDKSRDLQLVGPLQAAIHKVRALESQGERVAVLDPFKTFIYLEAGARPWTGDAALFMNTWTRAASAALVDRFLETGPRYALIRRVPLDGSLIFDTWTVLRDGLRSRYRVVEELPIFDLLFCETCPGPS